MDLKFAKYTKQILEALPHWFKIRKESNDSIGARFLNICGLRLDEIRDVMKYAYEQCYIDTADIDQADFCYKAFIPMPHRAEDINAVHATSTLLNRASSLKAFFGIDIEYLKNKPLYTSDTYYLDEERNIIYVRKKYNADAIHDNGKIDISFKNGFTEVYDLMPHQIWNYFDEFGALLSCPRIPEESNVEYKERILDVFENPAGASLPGLINGIARELAIRKKIIWYNPQEDLELETPMIVLNSIRDDDGLIPISRIFLSESNTVVIKGNPSETRKMLTVSYVAGLEMHQLWNERDQVLMSELFTVDGKAKEKLLDINHIVNSQAPIFWDDFKWNEHYWDPNDESISGTGFIPNQYDASIKGFEAYKR